MKKEKKALVISGGGSKGAFGGGVAEYLLKNQNIEYEYFIGTSTGSLLISLLAIDKVDELKKAFTSVKQKDIFSVNPFIIKEKNDRLSIKINHLGIIKQFLKKKKSFGESNNLRKTISSFYTPENHELLKASGKKVGVTVSNLNTNKIEYKWLQECEYQDALDWLWISCNYLPFMSVVKKGYYEYADGGYASYVAVNEALNQEVTEIDIIVLKPENQIINYINFNNPFSLLLRVNDFMLSQNTKKELELAKTKSKKLNIPLNLYYIPIMFTDNPLVFQPSKMRVWWEKGYKYASKYFTSNPVEIE